VDPLRRKIFKQLSIAPDGAAQEGMPSQKIVFLKKERPRRGIFRAGAA